MEKKICSRCKMEKHIKHFHTYKGKPISACKDCKSIEYYDKTKKVNLPIINLEEVVDGILYIEQWKPIYGYEGLYEVSSFGRIKSLKRPKVTKDIILKLQVSVYGYWICTLYDKNKMPQTHFVHILVAKHFIYNPDKLPEVNHKKGNKKDARFHQLEWMTKLQNVNHAFSTGLVNHKGEKNANHSLKEVDVLDIFNSFLSHEELSEKYNVNSRHIRAIKKGERWGHITGKEYKRRYLPTALAIEIYNSGLRTKEACKKYNIKDTTYRQLKNRRDIQKYIISLKSESTDASSWGQHALYQKQ